MAKNDPVGMKVVFITGKGREFVNSSGHHCIEYDTATFIKTGDPVYVLGGKYRHGCMEYWINPGKFRLTDIGKMGKTVFLTIEDAEAKLAEWKAKNYDPMQEVPDAED